MVNSERFTPLSFELLRITSEESPLEGSFSEGSSSEGSFSEESSFEGSFSEGSSFEGSFSEDEGSFPEMSPLGGTLPKEFKRLSIMLQLVSERINEKRTSNERIFFISNSINCDDNSIVSPEINFVNINA